MPLIPLERPRENTATMHTTATGCYYIKWAVNKGEYEMFTIDQLIDYTLDWLTSGNLRAEILANNFQFISPFWQSNDKDTFLEKFLNPKEYREKSLSNILKFDPIIKLKSDDHQYFSIILRYHTKYGLSVDEAVLGTIKDGLLSELRSIYDLAKTKEAHRL